MGSGSGVSGRSHSSVHAERSMRAGFPVIDRDRTVSDDVAASIFSLMVGTTSDSSVVSHTEPHHTPAATQPTAAKPHFGTWGVDLSAMDTSVKPGDDFQRYTSGKWLDATEIPADRPSVGAFNDLRETTQEQLQKLITEGQIRLE